MFKQRLVNRGITISLFCFCCLIAGGSQAASAQGGSFLMWMDTAMIAFQGGGVEITLSAAGEAEIGSFNLLVKFDGKALSFLDLEPLGALADWEYLNYRIFTPDGCDPDCDTAFIRLTGYADLPDGENPGSVYDLNGDMLRISFRSPSECDYLNLCWYLYWAWEDCDDNTLTSVTGETVYLASDIETILPGENCLTPTDEEEKIADLDFVPGLICLVPPPDDRGDINLNCIPWEIGDAVLLSEYFVYGPAALGYPEDPYYENRVLASDINDDGTPLTIADLVLLMRIISGDTGLWNHR